MYGLYFEMACQPPSFPITAREDSNDTLCIFLLKQLLNQPDCISEENIGPALHELGSKLDSVGDVEAVSSFLIKSLFLC